MIKIWHYSYWTCYVLSVIFIVSEWFLHIDFDGTLQTVIVATIVGGAILSKVMIYSINKKNGKKKKLWQA